jgi:hypothetical protein
MIKSKKKKKNKRILDDAILKSIMMSAWSCNNGLIKRT